MSVFLVFKEGFSDRPNLDLISNLNLFYPDFFPRKSCASENFYRFFHTVFTLAPKALVLESLLLKYSRVRNKHTDTLIDFWGFFPWAMFIDFRFLKNFLRILNFLFLWLYIKESNHLLFKRGLCLLFLPNVPGAMSIQGGTFIPDSRVVATLCSKFL